LSQVEQIARRAYAAFAAGDIGTVLSILSPAIRWTEAEGGPYGGVYVGRQQVVENVSTKLGSEWEGFTATPHQFVASGDTVVALGEYGGVFQATGKRLKVPFAHVWKCRDGQAVSFERHTDSALHRAAMEHEARELATPSSVPRPS
jgi:hypothetical protein